MSETQQNINDTPPSVASVYAFPQFINMTGYTNITATITDTAVQVNQSEVFAQVTYPNGTTISYPMNISESGIFYFNFTDTAQYGRFHVTILASDTAGNTNSTEKTYFVTTFMTVNESVIMEAHNETVFEAPFSNTTLRLSTKNATIGSIDVKRSKVNLSSNTLSNNPGIYVLVNMSDSIRTNLSYVMISANYTSDEVSSLVESSLRLYRWNTTISSWDRLAGAGSPWYVRNAAVDISNNFVWANITNLSEFAVSGDLYVPPTYPPPGGSGGGGGGGGLSGENFSNIEIKEKYDRYIFKDRLTSYPFNNSLNPVLFVNITGNINAGEINAAVEVLKDTSTLVKSPAPGVVYKNINIWVGSSGFAVPRNIRAGIILFRIENAWLASNTVGAEDVTLYHWFEDHWNKLETTSVGKDSTYTFFEAHADRFSPFAISGKVSRVPVIMSPVTSTPLESVTVTATPGEASTPSPSGENLEIWPLFYAFIAVLFLKALGVPPGIPAWFYAVLAIASLAVMGFGPKVRCSLVKKKNREKFF